MIINKSNINLIDLWHNKYHYTIIGLSLQAMDLSHVALVSLNLSMEGFETYRCDSNIILGVNVGHLSKVLKLGDPSDSITL